MTLAKAVHKEKRYETPGKKAPKALHSLPSEKCRIFQPQRPLEI
jgi:hypothetical protein